MGWRKVSLIVPWSSVARLYGSRDTVESGPPCYNILMVHIRRVLSRHSPALPAFLGMLIDRSRYTRLTSDHHRDVAGPERHAKCVWRER